MGGRSEYRLNNLTQPFSLATTMGNSGTRCDDVVRMRVILSCGHRLVEALRVGLSGQGRHAIVGPKSRPQFGLSTDPVRTRVRTKVRTKYGPSTNQSTNQVRTQYGLGYEPKYELSTNPVRTQYAIENTRVFATQFPLNSQLSTLSGNSKSGSSVNATTGN